MEAIRLNAFFTGEFEKQVLDFIMRLPVSIQKPYPPAKIPQKNEQLANLLLSAFADGGSAEMTAIAQYMNHSQTISDRAVSNLLLYISLTEMLHLQTLATMITSLGGNLRYWNAGNAYWSGGSVEYGGSVVSKLSRDFYSEQEAIAGYESILRELRNTNIPGVNEVTAVIQRILEDENYHLALFKEAYLENGGVF
jgi:bacterioferritin